MSTSTPSPSPSSSPSPSPSSSQVSNQSPTSPSGSTTLQKPSTQNLSNLHHTTSLTLLVLCPLIALLPPRKLNLTTLTLGGLWLFSLSQVRKGTRRLDTPDMNTKMLDKEIEGEENEGVSEVIKEVIWDVWNQKGKDSRGGGDDDGKGK